MPLPTVFAKHLRALSKCTGTSCPKINTSIRSTFAQSVRKTPLPAHSALLMSTYVKEGDRCGGGDCPELLRVFHDKCNKQFFIDLSPEAKAVLQYKIEGQCKVNLFNTEVPKEFRQRGIAGRLAKVVLDHFAANKTYMRLSCTYLQKYVQQCPQAHHVKWILRKDGGTPC